ncbi:gamma-glutamylcyclotransferase family protein [Microbacterium sp. NPDC090007]|uniref:gamma-glutamylcyclotransferase family protein n=1 Tax=Microbacterium sp. NPDC090007 TaxID=3364204 RepID=UPI0037F28996
MTAPVARFPERTRRPSGRGGIARVGAHRAVSETLRDQASRRTAPAARRVSSLGRVSDGSGTAEFLFSYGTLQLPDVQLDTFGRVVAGEDDVLAGYRLEWVDVGDERVAQLSGLDEHPILRHTGDPRDRVFGRVLALDAEELDAADEYEVALYRRTSVVLASGRFAWVYVSA